MHCSVWARPTSQWNPATNVSGCQSRDGTWTLTRMQGTCGDAIVADPERGDDSVCNVPCEDDQNEFCGGLKLLKRATPAQKFLAAYSSLSSTLPSSTSATATVASLPSITGVTLPSLLSSLLPSLRPSLSHYANTTSSRSMTASTSSLPFGCDSKLLSQTSSMAKADFRTLETSSVYQYPWLQDSAPLLE